MYEKLIKRKTELGLSIKDIAKATKAPERTLERIFSPTEKNYKRGVSADILHPILKVLNITFEELFEDVSTKHEEMQHRIDELVRENEILKLQLEHKNELLAVHGKYLSYLQRG